MSGKYVVKWDGVEPRVVSRTAAEKLVEMWTRNVTNHDWSLSGSLDGNDLRVVDGFEHTATICREGTS